MLDVCNQMMLDVCNQMMPNPCPKDRTYIKAHNSGLVKSFCRGRSRQCEPDGRANFGHQLQTKKNRETCSQQHWNHWQPQRTGLSCDPNPNLGQAGF